MRIASEKLTADLPEPKFQIGDRVKVLYPGWWSCYKRSLTVRWDEHWGCYTYVVDNGLIHLKNTSWSWSWGVVTVSDLTPDRLGGGCAASPEAATPRAATQRWEGWSLQFEDVRGLTAINFINNAYKPSAELNPSGTVRCCATSCGVTREGTGSHVYWLAAIVLGPQGNMER